MKYMSNASSNKNTYRKILLVILAMLFLVLTGLVVTNENIHLDQVVSKRLQPTDPDHVNDVMVAFSIFGNVPSAIIVTLSISAILYFLKNKRESILVLSTLITGIVSWIIKILVDRPRPTADLVNILEKTSFQSFPSGHTLFYTVLFGNIGILIFYADKIKPWLKSVLIFAFVLIVLIAGYSRIYLGSHWFTDVLGGLILGLMLLIGGEYWYRRPMEHKRS